MLKLSLFFGSSWSKLFSKCLSEKSTISLHRFRLENILLVILVFIIVTEFLFQIVFTIVFHGDNGSESAQTCVKWVEESFFWLKESLFVCFWLVPSLLIQCLHDL